MASSYRKTPAVLKASSDEERGFPWLETALAVSGLALFFQFSPGAWWNVMSVAAVVFSYVDVRGWTWRSYAVVCAIAIAALIILKGRQENS